VWHAARCTLREALLFWRRLTNELVKLGFEINPYVWCVVNKIINGSQCTILWHVDDLKISHINPNVVTSVISSLEGIFGVDAPLTKTRRTKHDYLGMTLDYGDSGKVRITMFDYINSILDCLPANMDGGAPTPSHLFDGSPVSAEHCLDVTMADLIHHCKIVLSLQAGTT
jgi:hypothetical protein